MSELSRADKLLDEKLSGKGPFDKNVKLLHIFSDDKSAFDKMKKTAEKDFKLSLIYQTKKGKVQMAYYDMGSKDFDNKLDKKLSSFGDGDSVTRHDFATMPKGKKFSGIPTSPFE